MTNVQFCVAPYELFAKRIYTTSLFGELPLQEPERTEHLQRSYQRYVGITKLAQAAIAAGKSVEKEAAEVYYE